MNEKDPHLSDGIYGGKHSTLLYSLGKSELSPD